MAYAITYRITVETAKTHLCLPMIAVEVPASTHQVTLKYRGSTVLGRYFGVT
jgi:hypothetical protein